MIIIQPSRSHTESAEMSPAAVFRPEGAAANSQAWRAVKTLKSKPDIRFFAPEGRPQSVGPPGLGGLLILIQGFRKASTPGY